MPRGTIIHFELLSAQFERSAAFYADVFGWKADEAQVGGHRGFHAESPGDGDEGPTGSWVLEPLAQTAGPVPYIAVDDVDACLAAVERAGGRVLLRRQSLGSRGVAGLFVDPDGNVLGCLTPPESESRARANGPTRARATPSAKPAASRAASGRATASAPAKKKPKSGPRR
jgi:predicted enzyme related to lactoylglutathione lyase